MQKAKASSVLLFGRTDFQHISSPCPTGGLPPPSDGKRDVLLQMKSQQGHESNVTATGSCSTMAVVQEDER